MNQSPGESAAPTAPSLFSTDPWSRLRRHTTARLALGRSGGSLPTAAVLAFAHDHALARDAVHAPFDPEALAADLRSLHPDVLVLASAAPDRAAYLRRPDLGRRLSPESISQLLTPTKPSGGGSVVGPQKGDPAAVGRASSADQSRPHSPATAQAGRLVPGWQQQATGSAERDSSQHSALNSQLLHDLVVLVSDGLSALAAHRQAAPLLAALLPRLRDAGFALGPLGVVRHARVALQDEIGGLLKARQSLMLLGERPGLGTPDSLGAYLTWDPRPGRTDAERNCVSNIRPGGLPPVEAAERIAALLIASRQRQLSGTGLKEEAAQKLR